QAHRVQVRIGIDAGRLEAITLPFAADAGLLVEVVLHAEAVLRLGAAFADAEGRALAVEGTDAAQRREALRDRHGAHEVDVQAVALRVARGTGGLAEVGIA